MAVATCLWVSAVAERARADESIAAVTLTQAGPNRSIPVGQSFYLRGTASKGTQRVQAVVVRKSTPFLFGSTGPTCSALSASLGELRVTKSRLELPTGLAPTAALWMPGEPAYDAYVTAPWVRPTEKGTPDEPSFSVFVPYDREFFQPGASFCLFVFREEEQVDRDQTALRALLLDQAQAYDGCAAAADLAGCRKKVEADFGAGWQAVLSKVSDPDEAKRLEVMLFDGEEATARLERGTNIVRAMLDAWRAGAFVADFELASGLLAVDRDGAKAHGLASASLVLMAKQGVLHEDKREYFAPGAKESIEAITFLDNARIIVIDKTRARAAYETLDEATNQIALPQSTLTLRDLIELSAKRVRVGNAYLSPPELSTYLQPLWAGSTGLSDAERTGLEAVATHLDQLARFIDEAAVEYRRSAKIDRQTLYREKAASLAWMKFELGRFLVEDTKLVKCDEATLPGPQCWERGNQEGWPNYPVGSNPLALLSTQIRNMIQSRRELRELDLSVRRVGYSVQAVGPPRGVRGAAAGDGHRGGGHHHLRPQTMSRVVEVSRSRPQTVPRVVAGSRSRDQTVCGVVAVPRSRPQTVPRVVAGSRSRDQGVCGVVAGSRSRPACTVGRSPGWRWPDG